MPDAQMSRKALPEDPEALGMFFLGRAQQRDRASRSNDSQRKADGPAKVSRDYRDIREPRRTPARPNRGPRTTTKEKPKP